MFWILFNKYDLKFSIKWIKMSLYLFCKNGWWFSKEFLNFNVSIKYSLFPPITCQKLFLPQINIAYYKSSFKNINFNNKTPKNQIFYFIWIHSIIRFFLFQSINFQQIQRFNSSKLCLIKKKMIRQFKLCKRFFNHNGLFLKEVRSKITYYASMLLS